MARARGARWPLAVRQALRSPGLRSLQSAGKWFSRLLRSEIGSFAVTPTMCLRSRNRVSGGTGSRRFLEACVAKLKDGATKFVPLDDYLEHLSC